MKRIKTEQNVAAEMDFFFNVAASQMGISSTFQSFKKAMEGAGRVAATEPEYNVKTSNAVLKYNRIYATLMRLTPTERAILSATYDTEVMMPLFLTVFFGKYAGAACFVLDNIDDLLSLFHQKTKIIHTRNCK